MTGENGVRRIQYQIRHDNILCHYCQTARATTADHVVPQILGGPNSIWNIQPACMECNHNKRDDLPICPCDKCHNALVRWSQNPTWTDIALKRMDTQAGSVGKVISDIENIRLPLLRDRRQTILDKIEYVNQLVVESRYAGVLTSDAEADSVEV